MNSKYFLIFFISLFGFALSTGADEVNRENKISGDIFGKGGRYIHPSLTVGGIYSDNIFNTSSDEKDDFIWVISPEVWVALPGANTKAMDLSVSSRTPAGLTMSRWNPEAYRRYQAYLLYGIDIYRYTDFTEENEESHRLEGLFQYDFSGGLTLELVDQYLDTFDPISVSAVTRRENYTENLFNAILSYDMTAKLKLRLDYTRVDLDYEEQSIGGIPLIARDRQDNGYSGYLFFKVKPKTSVFGQYRYIDIDYDFDNLVRDSKEHHYLGGIEWLMTAKSRGRFKAGYGVKEFDDEAVGEENNFILEGELNHSFSPKTTLGIVGFRRTDEATIQETNYLLAHGVSATYHQRLTAKLAGHVYGTYAWDQYQGAITFGGISKEREDRYFRVRPSLRFQFTRWLMAEAAYMYTQRDSNFPIFDFTENRFSIRLSASL